MSENKKSPPGRRQFLQAAGIVMTGIAGGSSLAACGGGGSSASSDNTSTTPLPPVIGTKTLPPLQADTLPRLRGAHLTEYYDWAGKAGTGLASLEHLAQWGGNVLRLFVQPYAQDGSPLLPGRPLSERLLASADGWSTVIEWALKRNVYVMLNFSPYFSWPVQRTWPDDGRSLWLDASARAEVVDAWKALAQRFKGRSGILFDLINEPHSISTAENGLVSKNLPAFYTEILAAVRQEDPTRWVVIEPEWGEASNITRLPVLTDTRLLYSAHFYTPHELTHQGIGSNPTAGTVFYPGLSRDNDGELYAYWSRDALRSRLATLRAFQKAHNLRVIIGEFGCSRTAQATSRANWTRDAYALFEEYGWDSIHFRYELEQFEATFRQSWALEKSEIETICREQFFLNLV